MTDITVSSVTDFAALETKWRDLETRSELSFFQSWTWTGCLVQERFPRPVLVEARVDGRTVALALFNRYRGSLYLGETGNPRLDCIYIELNGVMVETGTAAGLTAECLRAARNGFPKRRLVLSGVSATTVAAAAEVGYKREDIELVAPWVDLSDRNSSFLDRRSANARQQINRSNRDYSKSGAIIIDRAETVTQAKEYLGGMAALHQRSWVNRGRPGSFASPFFGRFHDALIERGFARDEIDLFRLRAGERTIGFLYNFRYRGHSLAYQSGFDYDSARSHEKPGYTCHSAAVHFAAGWGATRYDFLAGNSRYKHSLSDQSETLHWIEVAEPYSPLSLIARARDAVRHWRSNRPIL